MGPRSAAWPPAIGSRLRRRDGREVGLGLGDVAHEVGEQELGSKAGDGDDVGVGEPCPYRKLKFGWAASRESADNCSNERSLPIDLLRNARTRPVARSIAS